MFTKTNGLPDDCLGSGGGFEGDGVIGTGAGLARANGERSKTKPAAGPPRRRFWAGAMRAARGFNGPRAIRLNGPIRFRSRPPTGCRMSTFTSKRARRHHLIGTQSYGLVGYDGKATTVLTSGWSRRQQCLRFGL